MIRVGRVGRRASRASALDPFGRRASQQEDDSCGRRIGSCAKLAESLALNLYKTHIKIRATSQTDNSAGRGFARDASLGHGLGC